jgi:hypothetical protein
MYKFKLTDSGDTIHTSNSFSSIGRAYLVGTINAIEEGGFNVEVIDKTGKTVEITEAKETAVRLAIESIELKPLKSKISYYLKDLKLPNNKRGLVS